VTKINSDTGEIIWRLSGAHSDFTFVNDPLNGFRNQHAIRSTGNGRYLLFDNGNLHSPSVSRAVEYELDLDAMTATVVWEFREMPDVYSHYMANTQRLPNGNTLINWAVGSLPKLTEVRPDGTKAFWP
ncbi:MAG: aryl-sulfate sulfotransferase, partial [Planctomycetota bacterium]